jgi:hypothetical protein
MIDGSSTHPPIHRIASTPPCPTPPSTARPTNRFDRPARSPIKQTNKQTQECIPAEAVFEEQHKALPSRWMVPPIVEELKAKARALVRVVVVHL